MRNKKNYIFIIFIAFLVLLRFASGDSKVKGSIAFVIDDTDSMSLEIKQVKAKTYEIFEAVFHKSNTSQIDEFIIVTFNDPGAYVEVKTNRFSTFKRKLNLIRAHGGDDCPEMAMKGIELALNESKPNSFLYAFTDASAVDYMKFEDVKSLALEKSIQINFLLTGKCNDTIEEQHTVYDRLAAATSGQVFHIGKLEITKIINYILVNVKDKRTILLHKTNGYRCDRFKFTVDSKVWDVYIALSAPRPKGHDNLIVFGPDGNRASTTDFINSENTTIVKLEGKPGEYSIDIRDCEEITVVVSAATSVTFRHGFSSIKPSSLDETSIKPLLGKKSHLAIALDNDERDVTLKTVEIRDMDDKLLKQLSLKLVDEEKQFYITDLFATPEKTFKVAINGYTKLNEKITRVSITSIEYHRPESFLEKKQRPAKATVIGSKKVLVEYDEPVMLKCKVNGFPRPKFWWLDEFDNVMEAKVNTISPYEHISILHTGKLTMNVTFTCVAENFVKSSDYVSVIVEKRSFFHVLEYPKDVAVEYDKSVELNLKIDAMPPATIIWFQADKEIRNNHDFHISADGSLLKIKNAQPGLEGKYYVKATNGNEKVEYDFDVTVIGTEVPRIDKQINSYKNLRKSSVDIKCRVIQGKPVPTISWSFDHDSLGKFRNLKETAETIHIEDVSANDVGTYRCNVSNVVGSDHHEMQLYMEDPIKIETPKQTTFNAKLRSKLVLPCHVTGYPEPRVRWFHYPPGLATAPKNIKSDKHNNVVLQNIQLEDEGDYKCIAMNAIGKDEITYTVNVPVRATITPDRDLVTNNVQLVEGDLLFKLSCNNRGSPKPTVTWTINGTEVGSGEGFEILSDGTLAVSNVTLRHKGTYRCKAENVHGSDTMEYEVNVHKFPPIVENSRIILLTEGKKEHNIFCDIVVKDDFLARWFKDDKFLNTSGTYTVKNVKKTDAGYYTCRLSTPQGVSFSFHNRAIVGTKPKFITEANSTITFKAGTKAHLDCSATGEPIPRIKWWYGNKQIYINATQFTFIMNTQNTEKSYMCSVSNEFDTIKRYFEITPEECLMDLEKDFTAQQPLLLTGNRTRHLPYFNISDGCLRMRKLKFTLVCPNSFISFNHSNYGNSLVTSCVGDSMFDLGGRAAKASEITCDTPIIPIAKNLAQNCLGSNTEELIIGFDLDGSFVPVFTVCFNESTKTPIFVKHGMHKAIANTIPEHVAEYTRGAHLSFEFEQIYDCRNQVDAISSFTGKSLKRIEDEKCCFKKRQLVNPKDVLPGISQVATYHYLNVVPQWSTCGTENWDEVERRVRLYALEVKTTIWTGATSVLKNFAPIILKDKLNQELHVPLFIWKVVENQLAIIHINVPGLTSTQASPYVLCDDICEKVDWMRNSQWRDVDKGFIYCCTIEEFESFFDYEGVFVTKQM